MNEGNTRTVWITYADSRKDFSDAEKFGKLKDVFSTVPREYNAPRLIEHARSVLSKAQDGDFLLVVGDPTLTAVCVAVMIEMFGKATVLRWSRDEFCYKPLELDFEYE